MKLSIFATVCAFSAIALTATGASASGDTGKPGGTAIAGASSTAYGGGGGSAKQGQAQGQIQGQAQTTKQLNEQSASSNSGGNSQDVEGDNYDGGIGLGISYYDAEAPIPMAAIGDDTVTTSWRVKVGPVFGYSGQNTIYLPAALSSATNANLIAMGYDPSKDCAVFRGIAATDTTQAVPCVDLTGPKRIAMTAAMRAHDSEMAEELNALSELPGRN